MNKKLMSTVTVAGLATLGGITEASADTQYTIEKGDTLSHIALEYGTTVRQIAAQNNVANPDLIFAGETLWINGVPTQVRPVIDAPEAPTQPVEQAPVVEVAPVQEAPKPVEVEKPAPKAVATKAVEAEKPAPTPVAPKVVEVEKAAPVQEAPKTVEVENTDPVETLKAVEETVAPQAVEVEEPVVEDVQAPMFEPTQPQVNQQVAPVVPSTPAPVQPQVNENASVYDRFLNAGGTDAMWNVIVMPESGGIPDIVSPNGYRGLGQTKEAWGVGSVEEQTAGMLNYAQERYGSVAGAIAFRLANGWW